MCFSNHRWTQIKSGVRYYRITSRVEVAFLSRLFSRTLNTHAHCWFTFYSSNWFRKVSTVLNFNKKKRRYLALPYQSSYQQWESLLFHDFLIFGQVWSVIFLYHIEKQFEINFDGFSYRGHTHILYLAICLVDLFEFLIIFAWLFL